MKTTKSADKRFLSVDVLRGFDMFWLVGGTGLVLAIVKLCGRTVQDLLLPQMDHADWIYLLQPDFSLVRVCHGDLCRLFPDPARIPASAEKVFLKG